METLTIGIIVGSTRVGRVGSSVGQWILSNTKDRQGVNYTLIEVADYQLPLFGEVDATTQAHKWNQTLQGCDGFIFAVAEYNHSITASLKNALDYAKDTWINKAAGIVSYGFAGGARAAEHLRTILGELQIADVRQHVLLSLVHDMDKEKGLMPQANQVKSLLIQFSQVEAWAKALKTLR